MKNQNHADDWEKIFLSLNLFKKVVDPKIGFSQSRLLHCKIWLFKAKILSFVASSFISVMQTFLRKHRWVKGVRIWSLYGPYFLYSVRMQKKYRPKNYEYGHFSRSALDPGT